VEERTGILYLGVAVAGNQAIGSCQTVQCGLSGAQTWDGDAGQHSLVGPNCVRQGYWAVSGSHSKSEVVTTNQAALDAKASSRVTLRTIATPSQPAYGVLGLHLIDADRPPKEFFHRVTLFAGNNAANSPSLAPSCMVSLEPLLLLKRPHGRTACILLKSHWVALLRIGQT
jgi:hypothetical protein